MTSSERSTMFIPNSAGRCNNTCTPKRAQVEVKMVNLATHAGNHNLSSNFTSKKDIHVTVNSWMIYVKTCWMVFPHHERSIMADCQEQWHVLTMAHSNTINIWLVAWNFVYFPKKLGIIIPTDELIFFRGVGIPATRISWPWRPHVVFLGGMLGPGTTFAPFLWRLLSLRGDTAMGMLLQNPWCFF